MREQGPARVRVICEVTSLRRDTQTWNAISRVGKSRHDQAVRRLGPGIKGTRTLDVGEKDDGPPPQSVWSTHRTVIEREIQREMDDLMRKYLT